MRLLTFASLTIIAASTCAAANDSIPAAWKKFVPRIDGTFRGRYELITEGKTESRFQVRNARVGITGNILPILSYRAQIDLCDRGKVKMLDAYGRFTIPGSGVNLTLGQFRMPYTVDAHRDPATQLFANRSYVAKYGGSMRDVGISASWDLPVETPLQLQAGVFNGSGLTDQNDYWTRSFTVSAKARTTLFGCWTVEGSFQRMKPGHTAITSWDAATAYTDNSWHIEAEYVRRCYEHGKCRPIDIADIFALRHFTVRNPYLTRVSALARYDYISNITESETQTPLHDSRHHRITVGATLRLGGYSANDPLADIRLNYEQLFHPGGEPRMSTDRSRIVAELMIHF